jgi:hypothetical protein
MPSLSRQHFDGAFPPPHLSPSREVAHANARAAYPDPAGPRRQAARRRQLRAGPCPFGPPQHAPLPREWLRHGVLQSRSAASGPLDGCRHARRSPATQRGNSCRRLQLRPAVARGSRFGACRNVQDLPSRTAEPSFPKGEGSSVICLRDNGAQGVTGEKSGYRPDAAPWSSATSGGLVDLLRSLARNSDKR